MLDKLPLAISVHMGNSSINFLLCMCMVTLLHNHHFPALPSFSSNLHCTWHLVYDEAHDKANDFQVIGHRGNHISSTTVAMLCLKCSLFHSVFPGQRPSSPAEPSVHLGWLQNNPVYWPMSSSSTAAALCSGPPGALQHTLQWNTMQPPAELPATGVTIIAFLPPSLGLY